MIQFSQNRNSYNFLVHVVCVFCRFLFPQGHMPKLGIQNGIHRKGGWLAAGALGLRDSDIQKPRGPNTDSQNPPFHPGLFRNL